MTGLNTARFAQICALVASVMLSSAATADDDTGLEPLSGVVYGIIGGDANVTFSAGVDGLFFVDSGGRSGARGVLRLAEDISAGPVRYLVNTHAHQAHTGGNAILASAGAVVIAHEAVREVLHGNDADEAALPTFTLPELGSVTFDFNDEMISVMHVPPAHAPGNVIVHYTESNVIHMGELFSTEHYPSLAGGTLTGWIRALDGAVRAADVDTVVVPARGPVSDREGLIAYREMLIAIREKVTEALDQGQTLEQFIALRPTRAFDPLYGDPSDPLFLPVVYEEFSLRRSPAGN